MINQFQKICRIGSNKEDPVTEYLCSLSLCRCLGESTVVENMIVLMFPLMNSATHDALCCHLVTGDEKEGSVLSVYSVEGDRM